MSSHGLIKIGILLVTLPLISLSILFTLPRPSVEIEPPRPDFWSYPDVSQANYHYSIDESGRLHLHLEHPILHDVTPKMLSWWYQHLAIGKTTIEGIQYTYYQLFHLSEHGKMNILESADDGGIGMGEGSLVYREEMFGPFASKGKARVEYFAEDGFIVEPTMGGFKFGSIRHRFEKVKKGTLYTVDTVLGSEQPIIGTIVNQFIQQRRFPPPVVEQWIRHQVEEVGSLPHFLPQLYRDAKPLE